jgi:dimethylamine/trimethylamine dehydrogenase
MPIPGADASLDHVYTPEQIMEEGTPVVGDRVLVYDCEGYFMGVSLAERLALEGKRVSLVTPLPSPSPYLEYTGENQLMIPRLHELGVKIVVGEVIDSIAPGFVRSHLRAYPAKQSGRVADAVVLVTQRVPNAALYKQLKNDPGQLRAACIEALHRVGDCLAPRQQVADAIFDGHRLAREIDSDDPAVPLPWIRENRVIGATDSDYDSIVGDTAPRRPTSELIKSLVHQG